MGRMELTLSPGWVEGDTWGIQEGLRELVQNARDEEILNDHRLEVVWYPKSEVLLIRNYGARLDRKTLLLGSSDKRNSDDAIGGFGTGYKLAMLALTAKGKTMTLQNGSEAWKVSIEHSESYNAEVLVLDVRKRKESAGGPGKDPLSWSVSPVTREELNEMLMRSLFLASTEEKSNRYIIETVEYAGAINCVAIQRDEWDPTVDRVLMGDAYRGRVYVKGLYVFDVPTKDEAKYGYDFGKLQLDESRKMADPWDFKWRLGELMKRAADANDQVLESYVEMVKEGSDEAGISYGGATEKVAEAMLASIKHEHGEDAIVVKDDITAKKVKKAGLKAVVVGSKMFELVEKYVPEPHGLLESMKGDVKAIPEKLSEQAMMRLWRLQGSVRALNRAREWTGLQGELTLKAVHFVTPATWVFVEGFEIRVAVESLDEVDTYFELLQEVIDMVSLKKDVEPKRIAAAAFMANDSMGLEASKTSQVMQNGEVMVW